VRCQLPVPGGDLIRSVPRFQPLDDAALERLGDEQLIAYMRTARDAGHPSAADALAILVFGHWANVERRVRLKLPESQVEDLTGDIIADAIASAFDGSSAGEFVSWLATITKRAIADFYRRGPGRARTVPLGGGDDDAYAEPAAPSEQGAVEVRDAIERVLGMMREDHRRVVDIIVFEDLPAAAAVRAVPGMTEANAHQIVSRFRHALREALKPGGDTGDG
jgi:DNA-directed RNA polymerase specialized sigma24 family protein